MNLLPAADLDHVLQHTRPLWEELRDARIFITGGTGFFGKWLLGTLSHANHVLDLRAEAVVLTRSERPPRDRIRFATGDVRSFIFPAGAFSHVIHAATTSSAPVEADEMFDTIVQGTRRVLEFSARCGAEKVLFTSSGAIYGPQPPDLSHIPETFVGKPETPYGKGKAEAEHLCLASGLAVKIARCFAFVGPHLPLDAHFAAGNFLRDAMAGGPVRVGGDGRPWRSYLHAADLAIWLWTILFRGATGRSYNVGSEQAVTIATLARETAALIGPPCEIQVAQSPGSAPDPRYVPCTRRAQDDLGLREHFSLVESLRRTFSWHDATRLVSAA